MRVLVAPAAMKTTATAHDLAAAIAEAVRSTWPDADIDIAPLADGGDGTVDVLLHAGYRAQELPAVDAMGQQTMTVIARNGSHAVIELARTCGMASVRKQQPFLAHTQGLGVAAVAAIADGVREITFALGGSASTDGGSGLLSGLGWQLLDSRGAAVAPGLSNLTSIIRVIPAPDAQHSPVTVNGWTDVQVPLCGPTGAARGFGPQKGLTADQALQADLDLGRWACLLNAEHLANTPGAGAAGGTGLAILALGGTLTSGSAQVQRVLNLPERLAIADLVITAEGCWDQSSLHGKATGQLVRMANERQTPTVVISAAPVGQGPAQGLAAVLCLADEAGPELTAGDPAAAIAQVLSSFLLDRRLRSG